MRSKGVTVGFFGSFYPMVDRLSTTSTGLVALFSMSEKIEKVIVFSPQSSVLSNGLDSKKIRMIPSWKYDSVTSLIKTLFKMIKMKKYVDIYFFNIFLTSFGSSRKANVTGLLLPILLARLTGKRVCTYMHNFIETQNIEKLGYRKTWWATKIANLLERLIAHNTLLLVPLKSQRTVLETILHTKVHDVVIPYVEGLCSFMCSPNVGPDSRKGNGVAPTFLLFGSWGPQKDLEGALTIFSELSSEGYDLQVVVAGKVNSNFPSYSRKIENFINDFPVKNVKWTKNVPEENISELFYSSDVLFLPYNAAGGYSAVMNVGAFYGIKMVAYDIPELREFNSIINAGCVFVDPSDNASIKRTLLKTAEEAWAESSSTRQNPKTKLQESLYAIENLISIIVDDRDSTRTKDG